MRRARLDDRQGVIPGVSALRPSQRALLDALCRAQSAASGNFLAVGTFGGTFIRHDGLPEPLKDFAFSDLNELQAQGMIRLTGKSGSSTRFEISNDGWKYWEAHQETGVERIEAEVRRLLDPAANVGPYASAFARCKEAEAMLWQDRDGEHWVTEVGHVCREAMQAFAAAFCAEQGQAVTSGPSNTVDRIRAGLDTLRERLPEAYAAFYDAVLAYWGTVSDLVQDWNTEPGRRASRPTGTTRGSS